MPDENAGKGTPEDPSAKKVDEEWKKKAREEKSKTAGAETGAPPGEGESAGRPRGAPPKPDFALFVTGLATQAMMHMGAIENPATGKREVDLEAVKYMIDLLELIEEKTKGNLTEEESQVLGTMLYDLRVRYVAAVG